jgi:hypothetical protein
MTEQEANALIERIKEEEGDRVEVEQISIKNAGHIVAALNVMLRPGQRRMKIVKADEWNSLRLAWQQIG